MTISIHAEIAFDKLEHPFMIKKNLNKLIVEGTFLNIINSTNEKPIANIIFNNENMKAFSYTLERREWCLIRKKKRINCLSWNNFYLREWLTMRLQSFSCGHIADIFSKIPMNLSLQRETIMTMFSHWKKLIIKDKLEFKKTCPCHHGMITCTTNILFE